MCLIGYSRAGRRARRASTPTANWEQRVKVRSGMEEKHQRTVIAVVTGLAVGITSLFVGCSGPPQGTSDPEAKIQLLSIGNAFKFYSSKNKTNKLPPSEKAFADFLGKLSAQEKVDLRVGDDLDKYLTSARDGQKFVIRYGAVVDPGGRGPRLLAWEQTGEKGMRFVLLAHGYVEEYDDGTFQEMKR